jgi:hypothetical protein
MILEVSRALRYERLDQQRAHEKDLVFKPIGMLVLDGTKDHPGRRILLVRWIPGTRALGGWPLLIDPKTGSMQIWDNPIGMDRGAQVWFTHEGVVYTPSERMTTQFFSFGPPDYKRTSCSRLGVIRPDDLARRIMYGNDQIESLLVDQGYVHLLKRGGWRWAIARLGDHAVIEPVRAEPEGSFEWDFPRICRSHHYGLILLVGGYQTAWPTVYRVKIDQAVYQRADKLAADEDAEDAEVARRMEENRVRLEKMKNEPFVPDVPLEPVSPLVWAEVVVVLALLAFLVYRWKRRVS